MSNVQERISELRGKLESGRAHACDRFDDLKQRHFSTLDHQIFSPELRRTFARVGFQADAEISYNPQHVTLPHHRRTLAELQNC